MTTTIISVPWVTLAAGTNSGKLEHSPELYSSSAQERPPSYNIVKTTSPSPAPSPFPLHPAVLLFSNSETAQSPPAKSDSNQPFEDRPDFVSVKELLQKYRHALEDAIKTEGTADSSGDAEKGEKRLTESNKRNPGARNLNAEVLIAPKSHSDINERLNQHTKASTGVPTSRHEGAQVSQSRMDESESRKPRPTKIISPSRSQRRGMSFDRFTGIDKG